MNLRIARKIIYGRSGFRKKERELRPPTYVNGVLHITSRHDLPWVVKARQRLRKYFKNQFHKNNKN